MQNLVFTSLIPFVVICLLAGSWSRAELSELEALVNGKLHGDPCSKVGPQHGQKFKLKCLPSDSLKVLLNESELFELGIFRLAVESQKEKDLCISDQIELLLTNDKALSSFLSRMLGPWYRWAQVRSLEEFCERHVLSKIRHLTIEAGKRKETPQEIKMRVAQALKNSPSKITEKEIEFCTDRRTALGFLGAKESYLKAVPVVSDPEYFTLADSLMGSMIYTRSSQTLSQENILQEARMLINQPLNSPNRDLIPITLSEASAEKIASQFRSRLSDLKRQRDSLAKKSKETLLTGLSKETKQFLFEDGSLETSLLKAGLIKSPEQIYNPSEWSNLDPGLACVFSRYTPSFTASAIDMGVVTVVSLLSGRGLAGLYKSEGPAGKVVQFLSGLSLYSSKELVNECINETKKIKRFDPNNEDYIEKLGPKEVPHSAFRMPEEFVVPSCKKIGNYSGKVIENLQPNCVRSILQETLPLPAQPFIPGLSL